MKDIKSNLGKDAIRTKINTSKTKTAFSAFQQTRMLLIECILRQEKEESGLSLLRGTS
jgi:hypothetical protein